MHRTAHTILEHKKWLRYREHCYTFAPVVNRVEALCARLVFVRSHLNTEYRNECENGLRAKLLAKYVACENLRTWFMTPFALRYLFSTYCRRDDRRTPLNHDMCDIVCFACLLAYSIWFFNGYAGHCGCRNVCRCGILYSKEMCVTSKKENYFPAQLNCPQTQRGEKSQ